MSIILTDQQDKTHERRLTIIRLTLLLLQVMVLLSNRSDQSSNILAAFPAIEDSGMQEFRKLITSFNSANTMALVFAVMQLLILYVGTNRFRVWPTIFSSVMHFVGTYLYLMHNQWQFEHIWEIYYVFSFVPLCAEIGVALYTAKG